MVNLFLGGGKIEGREFFPNNKKIHNVLVCKSQIQN